MENTAHTPVNDQTQRLQDLAEALLQACEAQEMPKDMAGITRFGRGLIVISRLLKAVHDQKPVKTKSQPVESVERVEPNKPVKAPDLKHQMTALLAAKKQSSANAPRRGYG